MALFVTENEAVTSYSSEDVEKGKVRECNRRLGNDGRREPSPESQSNNTLPQATSPN